MSDPKIGIIMGSVRQGRFCEQATDWLSRQTDKYQGLSFEILDLKDYPLPFYDEPDVPSAGKPAKNPVGRKWRKKLDTLDGFIFVSPEYNHGPSGVLKNAIDWAWYEWNTKPVAYMGYGNMGAARAIEHLRGVAVEVELVSVRPSVQIGGADMHAIWSDNKTIADFPHYEDAAVKMLDALKTWAYALRDQRSN